MTDTTAVRRIWPSSLFSRLFLILLIGLIASHVLTFGLFLYERSQTWESMLVSYTELDVPSSVAWLDRLPADERPQWLDRLGRRTYRFMLPAADDRESAVGQPDTALSARLAAAIERAVGKQFEVRASPVPGEPGHLRVHVKLSDGSPLLIEMFPSLVPMSRWLPIILAVQFAAILICTWVAVRLATRPLTKLAEAADSLGPDMQMTRLEAKGTDEIARASSAFNAMQDRMAAHMAERVQILASISHDLQTPITRMRLRTDLMDDDALRDSLQRDLTTMSRLVSEGIAYARSVHAATEAPVLADVNALMDSLVGDYEDAKQNVRLNGRLLHPIILRPQALRRVIGNLVDNALKFSGAAEIVVREEGEEVTFSVLDRGPGIPEHELTTVLQPFYRVEASRGEETGGAGLGLAIAQQLSKSLGGALRLRNREGGGLEASVRIPGRRTNHK
ncbi:MAG TPA: ATP-binding protein [Steroidobacter sp.]|uniref:ATP-binding protein n=1 Tax=Steroidobacter sp. TaxID=1978227 RepID=UPI002ED97117